MSDLASMPAPRPESAFAHASEAEFAHILDFYQVIWEYEAQVCWTPSRRMAAGSPGRRSEATVAAAAR